LLPLCRFDSYEYFMIRGYEAVLQALEQQSLFVPNIVDNRLVSENCYATQKHRLLPVNIQT
jgi:hypothetical protein